MNGGFTVPESVAETIVAKVHENRAWVLMSDEMLMDLGMEPRPGYWQRELSRRIAARRLSTRLRVIRYRTLGVAHERLTHAARALAGRPCCEDEL